MVLGVRFRLNSICNAEGGKVWRRWFKAQPFICNAKKLLTASNIILTWSLVPLIADSVCASCVQTLVFEYLSSPAYFMTRQPLLANWNLVMRRINSVVFPENIGPSIISILPFPEHSWENIEPCKDIPAMKREQNVICETKQSKVKKRNNMYLCWRGKKRHLEGLAEENIIGRH